MQIKVFMDVSEFSDSAKFDFEDLNLTEEQWNGLGDEEKKEALQKAIDDLPTQPYWVLTKFITIC